MPLALLTDDLKVALEDQLTLSRLQEYKKILNQSIRMPHVYNVGGPSLATSPFFVPAPENILSIHDLEE